MDHRATGHRLLELLPAIYREGDAGDLPALLAAFEALLFDDASADAGAARLPGIASQLEALPALFAPLGTGRTAGDDRGAHDHSEAGEPSAIDRTPARFLPWLANWLAFTPREVLEPWRLRRVVAGIVPLHGRRGTRAHLEALLALCFEELAAVRIDERGRAGLRVGSSRLGTDSLLAETQPFRFSVDIDIEPRPGRGAPPPGRLEQQVRAVIDFAKPAHTVYELRLHAARDGAEAPLRTEEPRHA